MAGKFVKKRWQWIVTGAVVAGIIVLGTGRDPGTGGAGAGDPAAGGSRSCTMKVTAATLNVRSGPDSRNPVVETLASGAVVSADRTTRNGFRQLGPDRWAAQLYLDPEPGSDCN